MNKSVDWFLSLNKKQQLIANAMYLAATEYVEVTKTEKQKSIDDSKRIAFISGFYTALKSLGIELPSEPLDEDA
jgi:hypothetical protein